MAGVAPALKLQTYIVPKTGPAVAPIPGAASVLEKNRRESAAAAAAAAKRGEMGTQSNRGGRKTRRRRRLMSRKYCKKTPCRRMGFTQKASCRPYKNCYTRRK
jgi:hypothetical protein